MFDKWRLLKIKCGIGHHASETVFVFDQNNSNINISVCYFILAILINVFIILPSAFWKAIKISQACAQKGASLRMRSQIQFSFVSYCT